MRLNPQQIQVIKQTVKDVFGDQAQVKLFGSRVSDVKKGGEIDLLVLSPCVVEKPVQLSSLLVAKIYRVWLGRKVDVVIDAPNLERQEIHQIANETGVLL